MIPIRDSIAQGLSRTGRGIRWLWHHGYVLVLASAAFVAGTAVVLFVWPQPITGSLARVSESEKVEARISARQIAAASFGGALLLLGLGYTARTLRLNREQHWTETLARGAEHLGSTNMAMRIRGIEALAGIARASPDHRGAVARILVGFLQERAPIDPENRNPPKPNLPGGILNPPHRPASTPDLNAAFGALCRLPSGSLAAGDVREISNIDLEGVYVSNGALANVSLRRIAIGNSKLPGLRLHDVYAEGLQVPGTEFDDATFIRVTAKLSTFTECSFRRATLRTVGIGDSGLDGCDFSSARLEDFSAGMTGMTSANFYKATLRGVGLYTAGRAGTFSEAVFEEDYAGNLLGADLREAVMREVRVHDAHVAEARFAKADLRGADFTTNVEGLESATFLDAMVDGAKWPDGFRPDSTGDRAARPE